MSDTNPAGWQPDPTGRHDHRYWDGSGWTDNVSDAGVAGTDPYTAASAAPDPTVADAAAPSSQAPAWGEPSAAAPADATAAWSATPGAPVPPIPPQAASGAPAGGGGSKKGLLIGGAILAAIAIAVVAVLALDGDDDDKVNASNTEDTTTTEGGGDSDGVRGELIELLQRDDQGALSQEQAECTADVVIDTIGADRLEGVDFSADEPPADLAEDFSAAFLAAVDECDLDIGGLTDSDTSTTVGSDDGGFTDSSELPDNFEEILADTYESSFGISRDKAECLAGKLATAIEDGSLTESESMSAIFDYLADCDISMEEIGAN